MSIGALIRSECAALREIVKGYHFDRLLERLERWAVKAPYGENREEACHEIIHFALDKRATHLNLSRFGLSSLPPDVLNMPQFEKMVSFDISENQLTQIPDEIDELKNLKHLDASKNHFKQLSNGISGLKNLRRLNLSYNYSLERLPNDIFSLHKECIVYLVACNVRSFIQKRTGSEGYSGPRFVLEESTPTLEEIKQMSLPQFELLRAKL